VRAQPPLIQLIVLSGAIDQTYGAGRTRADLRLPGWKEAR
jgi:hypothetical protein